MCGGQGRKNWPLKRSKLWTHNLKPKDFMIYEVCPKCYGTLNEKNHKCGFQNTLAKDDLCPKCLIILADADKAVGHYSKDMLQLDRIIRGEGKPAEKYKQAHALLVAREKRLLGEMENGRIKRG